jgi:hypothetical protein
MRPSHHKCKHAKGRLERRNTVGGGNRVMPCHAVLAPLGGVAGLGPQPLQPCQAARIRRSPPAAERERVAERAERAGDVPALRHRLDVARGRELGVERLAPRQPPHG